VNKLPIMRHLPPGVGQASQGQEQALEPAVRRLHHRHLLGDRPGLRGDGAAVPQLLQTVRHPLGPATAIGGACRLLAFWTRSLSIPSLIGFLMLMGLAAKNSILLVEYAIEREREGASQREALMEACRERARPIVMTTWR
jgi:HAE1 family hydrophobic/amphiphilic exporter-1